MKTQLHLTGNAKTLDALAHFLGALETLTPAPISPPKAVCGEDDVVYVEVGYRTDEETFLAGDYMAHIGATIVEEIDILIALAPFVVEPPRRDEGNAAE
jgi:hypothetical protein